MVPSRRAAIGTATTADRPAIPTEEGCHAGAIIIQPFTTARGLSGPAPPSVVPAVRGVGEARPASRHSASTDACVLRCLRRRCCRWTRRCQNQAGRPLSRLDDTPTARKHRLQSATGKPDMTSGRRPSGRGTKWGRKHVRWVPSKSPTRMARRAPSHSSRNKPTVTGGRRRAPEVGARRLGAPPPATIACRGSARPTTTMLDRVAQRAADTNAGAAVTVLARSG